MRRCNNRLDWVDDPEAPAPGLIPYSLVPQLERADYVFNANDSYWLTHPDELLTGFSPLSGAEAVPQSSRTRTNVMLLGESGDAWDMDDVETAIFSDRTVLAETLRPATVRMAGGCSPTGSTPPIPRAHRPCRSTTAPNG